MVYMDIDYMQDYKDFTVNEERFPDFEGFVQDMKKEKIHLVPIIDAGVKVEKDYDIYEEGCEKATSAAVRMDPTSKLLYGRAGLISRMS